VPSCTPSRIDGGKERQCEGHASNQNYLSIFNLRRELREKVDFGLKQVDIGEHFDGASNRFDIERERNPQNASGDGSSDANACAGDKEYSQNHPSRRSERSQYCDSLALIIDQHDLARNDIEGRNEDYERQN